MAAGVKRLPLYLATIVVCYFVAWTASYLLVNGPDFSFISSTFDCFGKKAAWSDRHLPA